ncbi:HAD-IA family hydrolase [Streptomyces sp. A7024]|uniref:HAD-IA family hydrolase n=1 Tax=Streptomyces coryli TaxID=1128680 RepID=A0A6G4TX53_9ACTN|nr:HAD-IA family hydrolase [Streptomyces coryli]NGN64464.1 HAD-IA family hydrolase [Streptomyces coryli]
MAIKGVLFDFSGTIFRIESAVSALSAVLRERGIEVAEGELAAWAERLDAAGGLPGGTMPQRMPEHLAELWETRDIDPERHRAAYTGLSREAALPWDVHDAIYDRHMTPAAWAPYPDTAEVLTELRGRGVRVGVLSNIGWDLRPVLRAHGVADAVDACVLSYEHGVQKPDPRLFRIACAELGLEPESVLMVGDDRRADGGAEAVGCGYLPVDHLPVAQRPEGLRPVLQLAG